MAGGPGLLGRVAAHEDRWVQPPGLLGSQEAQSHEHCVSQDKPHGRLRGRQQKQHNYHEEECRIPPPTMPQMRTEVTCTTQSTPVCGTITTAARSKRLQIPVIAPSGFFELRRQEWLPRGKRGNTERFRAVDEPRSSCPGKYRRCHSMTSRKKAHRFGGRREKAAFRPARALSVLRAARKRSG